MLAEPNRRQILDLLLAAQRPVSDLVAAMTVSQPAVSKHLRVLCEAGLVEKRGEGSRRLYRVQPEPFQEAVTWLEPYRRMWVSRLNALGQHLDAMPDTD